MIVAYQGVPGAFGHEAAGQVAGVVERRALERFADVIDAVKGRAADRGVLPVSNRYAGPVDGVAELIASSGLRVDRTFDLPVRLHLIARSGVTIEGLDTVTSHPMALRQCRERLAALGVATREATNTAVAAQSIGDDRTAALASFAAAECYGLHVLVTDCQDDPDNRTTFAVLARPD